MLKMMKKYGLWLSLFGLVGLLMGCNTAVSDQEMNHDMSSMSEEMDHEMAMPTITPGELTVVNVQANLALPTDTGSVWMIINNGTEQEERLVGAEIAGCGVIELHDMVIDENDVMVMRMVEGGEIPIPAGETVQLKRGGLHVMCLQKEAPLEPGTEIDIVLKFANAGDVAVTAPVVAPGDMPMNMEEGGMDH